MHSKLILCLALISFGLDSEVSAQILRRNRGSSGPFARFQDRIREAQDYGGAPTDTPKPTPPTGAPGLSRSEFDYQFDRKSLPETVNKAIGISKRRMLSTHINTPWQILHGILALRGDYQLRHQGRPVDALEYISGGAHFKGAYWFEKSAYGGRAHPYNGTMWDFEGHVNQTLALIAMSNPPLDHKFKVAHGEEVTMQDMVNHAKMMVNTKEEITWTLWFLTHYVDQDEEWTNAYNQYWSMEQLVSHQNRFEPTRAPCGGTHGLFALAYARNAYLQKHGQLRGAWLEADQKIQRYITTAKAMQNRDGSFATGFFKSAGHSQDVEERLKTSGHMLEWLMMALPKAELEQPWVESAVNAVAIDLIRSAPQNAECGALYHSLHALVLYRQRMMPDSVPQPETLAEIESTPVGDVVSTVPDGEAAPNVVENDAPESQVMDATKVAQLPEESTKSATSLPLPPQSASTPTVDADRPNMPATAEPSETEPEVPAAPAETPAAQESDEESETVAANEDKPSSMLLPIIKQDAVVGAQVGTGQSTPQAIRISPQKPAMAEQLPKPESTTVTPETKLDTEVTKSDKDVVIALPKGLLPILKPELMAGAEQEAVTK